MQTITVLVPVAKPKVKEVPLAPRPRDLNGKVVGLLWNGKPNGDIFLTRVKEILSQRYNLGGTHWQERFVSFSTDPINVGEIMQPADVVIISQAD